MFLNAVKHQLFFLIQLVRERERERTSLRTSEKKKRG